MVMEAPPSPQSVGREFVRQYYTLLNKAPTHLHRFYNNQSSFVHGGLDPPNHETSPMIGQKQIHQKIQQLNFRDCHAKITQVDAQATLGNGVVVQVTGELSNAGQPMRRFTQTFVLAAQSPKKYYVHNDIFRYQDEIVFDDGCDADRSETEDEMVQDRPAMNEMSPLTQQSMSYYNPNPAPLQPTLTPVPHHHGQPTANLTHVIPSPPIATVNGAAHPDDINIIPPGPLPQHVPPMQPPSISPMGNLQPGLAPLSPLMPTDDNQQSVDESPIESAMDNNYNMADDNIDMQEVNQDSSWSNDTMSNEPKTYATLLKSSSGSPYTNMPPLTNTYNAPPKSMSPPLQQNRYDNRDSLSTSQTGNQMTGPMGQRSGGNNRGPRNNNQQSRPPPRQESRTSGKNSFSEEGPNNYDERKKSQGYGNTPYLGAGDSNQLFLGNLPHIATEDELREIFAPYGTILVLRILSKPGPKGGPAGSRAPPNYGFITYDNQQAVQECLSARPIYYPFNDKEGTILNVEEKKTKDRMSYGGGGNRLGPDNGGPRNRDNGPRRGPGVPRNNGGPPVGGGNAGRPNNFNRPPPNRNSNNTFNNRR